MTQMAKYAALARGQSVTQKYDQLPDTSSPGVAVTRLYQFQSYFDDTLLETALLQQSKNEPIVGSTMKEEQISGYCVGLHPSSQTPVAFLPLVGGQAGASAPIILKPGQVYRPHGRPNGKPGHFAGFRWGLPFGWLGGGMATLFVFPSSDAGVDWPGNSEVIFHRQRMKIVAPASLPAAARKNWPMRFPWTQAMRGTISQQGAAVIGIKPSKVMMSLRLASLGAPADMRMVIQSSNDLDLSSAGAVVLTGPRFDTYTWGSYVANGGAGDLATNYPVVEYNGPLNRLAADDGGVCLIDMSASTLTDAYVDVVRYGKL